MCEILGDNCLDFKDDRAKIVISEKRSSYVAENTNRKLFCNYKVDRCIFGTESKKCDYLLIDNQDNKSYYIELKGSDLIAAVVQIDETLSKLELKLPNLIPFGRIVLSRVNTSDLRNSKYIKLKKRLSTKGGNLIHKTNTLKEYL